MFLQLPLTILTGAFMQEDLAARVDADRVRTGLLIAFLLAAGVFATRVFRTYQRSI